MLKGIIRSITAISEDEKRRNKAEELVLRIQPILEEYAATPYTGSYSRVGVFNVLNAEVGNTFITLWYLHLKGLLHEEEIAEDMNQTFLTKHYYKMACQNCRDKGLGYDFLEKYALPKGKRLAF